MITDVQARELANDEEFMKSFAMVDSIDEAQKLFNSKGIEATEEDIQGIVDYVNVNSDKATSGELTETDLDNVNGGIAVATLGAWFLTSVFINRVAYLGRLWLGR